MNSSFNTTMEKTFMSENMPNPVMLPTLNRFREILWFYWQTSIALQLSSLIIFSFQLIF